MASPAERVKCDICNVVRVRRMARLWRKLAGGGERKPPRDVPPGHLAVIVGEAGRRFVIRASYLNHPIFRQLLDQAYEKYGHYNHNGPLAIPCDESLFEDVVQSLRDCRNVDNYWVGVGSGGVGWVVEVAVAETMKEWWLGHLLIQQAIFLHGVHEQIEQLQTEMKRIQSFLKDADADASAYQGDERLRNLVVEIKDVAYDSEDVVDTFIFRVASRMKGSLYGVLKRYTCIFNEWINLHKAGTEIEAIQKRIHSITSSFQTYNIKNIGEGEGTSTSVNQRQRQLRRIYPHAEDEDVISLEKDIEALVAQMITTEERRRVISIVGMGGLGKTTLATKLYNHNRVKRHFDCSAWTFISQQCQRNDVLHAILKRVSAPTKEEMEIIEGMKEEELVEKLYQVLEEKRYLVVLDDIWSTETWDILKFAFPNGKLGSKILITTRNKEVALHADPFSLPHEPRCLTDEESWVLLCKKAFPKDVVARGDFLVTGMEKLGREIVKKCGGLPLAVVVLGGLLATKKSLYEWEMVYKNFNIHLSKGQQQPQGVLGILALSYYDLPYYLKPCFLYLGLFREDFQISTNQLIRLWMAEGFVTLPHEGEEGTMEDIAEKYLEELIFRCMVQVGRRDTNERVKTCRIHDLMRDLCITKAKEDSFLEILDLSGTIEVADSSLIAVAKARRCAIHFGYERYPRYAEKHLLAIRSGLTWNQVSNWFINARVRLWKPMIEEMCSEINNRKGQRSDEGADGNCRRHISIDDQRIRMR
ncbi:hypothetical protein HHK36_018096 [Tetracentron sinense]|uniref:Homeobox domain-containing protein n=1 Tax=Tetracentron sinense TaxID=13715 RepID=A0A834Z1N7_TETSI|nr:hypothetical protein HHK36_018096 [Tetracentron sinense]